MTVEKKKQCPSYIMVDVTLVSLMYLCRLLRNKESRIIAVELYDLEPTIHHQSGGFGILLPCSGACQPARSV
jgi:hypothetical protein